MVHEEYNLKILVIKIWEWKIVGWKYKWHDIKKKENMYQHWSINLPVLHSNSIVLPCPTFGIKERNSFRIGIGDTRSSFDMTYIRPFNKGPGFVQ